MVKIKFYVPNQDKNGDKLPDTSKEYIRLKIAYLAGGFSEYQVKGYWLNQDNKLLQEDTSIIECWINQELQDQIKALALAFKGKYNQESVLVELEGGPLFL